MLPFCSFEIAFSDLLFKIDLHPHLYQENSSLSDVSSENSGLAAANHRLSVPVFPSAFAPSPDSSRDSRHMQRPCSVAIMGPIYESSSDVPSKTQRLDARMAASCFDSSFAKQEPLTLEEALHELKTTLEDYQGQYVELQRLEEQVHALDRLLKVGITMCINWVCHAVGIFSLRTDTSTPNAESGLLLKWFMSLLRYTVHHRWHLLILLL